MEGDWASATGGSPKPRRKKKEKKEKKSSTTTAVVNEAVVVLFEDYYSPFDQHQQQTSQELHLSLGSPLTGRKQKKDHQPGREKKPKDGRSRRKASADYSSGAAIVTRPHAASTTTTTTTEISASPTAAAAPMPPSAPLGLMHKRAGSLEMLPSERRSRELRMSGIDEAMLRSILLGLDVDTDATDATTGVTSSSITGSTTGSDGAGSSGLGLSQQQQVAVKRSKRKEKHNSSSKSDDDMSRTTVVAHRRGSTGGGGDRGQVSAAVPIARKASKSSSKPKKQHKVKGGSRLGITPPEASSDYRRLSRSFDIIPSIDRHMAAAMTTTSVADAANDGNDDTEPEPAAAAAKPRKKLRLQLKKANTENELRHHSAATEPKSPTAVQAVVVAMSADANAAVSAATAVAPEGPIDETTGTEAHLDRPDASASKDLPIVAPPTGSDEPATLHQQQEKKKKKKKKEKEKSQAEREELGGAEAISTTGAVDGLSQSPPSASSISVSVSTPESPSSLEPSPSSSPASASPKMSSSPTRRLSSLNLSAPSSDKNKRRRAGSTSQTADGRASLQRRSGAATARDSTALSSAASLISLSTASLATSRPSREALRLPLADLESLRATSGGPDSGDRLNRLTTTKRHMVTDVAGAANGDDDNEDDDEEDQPSLEDSYTGYLVKRMKHRKKRKKKKKQKRAAKQGAAEADAGGTAAGEPEGLAETEADEDDVVGGEEEDQLFFAHLKNGFEHHYRCVVDGLPSSPPLEQASLPNTITMTTITATTATTTTTNAKAKKSTAKKSKAKKGEMDAGAGDEDEGDGLSSQRSAVRSRSSSGRHSVRGPRRSLSDTSLRARFLATQRRYNDDDDGDDDEDEGKDNSNNNIDNEGTGSGRRRPLSLKEKRQHLRRSRSIDLLELYKAKHTTRKKKERPVVALRDLRPTQFTVGMLAVAHQTRKINKMAKTSTPEQLVKYIAKKTVPVVMGPEQRYYMLDRHHAARALWDSEVDANLKMLHVQVLADLSDLSHEAFWDKMKRNRCTYLTKNGQDPLSPDLLPPNVGELSDDAYRSLAWAVKSRKGFKATCIPFAEFIWADFLRRELNKELSGEEDIYGVMDVAVATCHSASAAELPGFIALPPPASSTSPSS